MQEFEEDRQDQHQKDHYQCFEWDECWKQVAVTTEESLGQGLIEGYYPVDLGQNRVKLFN